MEHGCDDDEEGGREEREEEKEEVDEFREEDEVEEVEEERDEDEVHEESDSIEREGIEGRGGEGEGVVAPCRLGSFGRGGGKQVGLSPTDSNNPGGGPKMDFMPSAHGELPFSCSCQWYEYSRAIMRFCRRM